MAQDGLLASIQNVAGLRMFFWIAVEVDYEQSELFVHFSVAGNERPLKMLA